MHFIKYLHHIARTGNSCHGSSKLNKRTTLFPYLLRKDIFDITAQELLSMQKCLFLHFFIIIKK